MEIEKTEFLQLNFGKYTTILVYSQNKTSTGPKHFLSRVATIHSLKIRYVATIRYIFIHFNIFIQDDHFSHSSNCYQHGSCVHNTKDSHNTGNFTPYSFRIVFRFFNVPHIIKHGRYCETGPTVYSPYPRRLESLTICCCNYKGSTFYSVILRP